jgi:pimeloyl-ACP methyl ester carboxylesterase
LRALATLTGTNVDILFSTLSILVFSILDGVRVHYQEAGDAKAPAVVLIMVLLHRLWYGAKSFWILRQPAFALSSRTCLVMAIQANLEMGEYTIAGQANLIARLLDRLRIKRATIVGSSYGGAVAATCALDYPSYVSRLVLVGAVSNNRPLAFN